MIGGTVTEVVTLQDRVFVDTYCGKAKQFCAVYIRREQMSDMISIGDSVWWQGKYAFWTPLEPNARQVADRKTGRAFDVKLHKLGPSGATLERQESKACR